MSAIKARNVKNRAPKDILELSPQDEADLAGLVYIDSTLPGYTRKKQGRGFKYYSPKGELVKAPHIIRRIEKLVIPPAWTDVWICPLANGHLQATGYDAKGRKQYRYHERWRQQRDGTKYDKVIQFGHMLPRIRQRIQECIRARTLSKDQVVATVIHLLERTLIRVGNEEYAKSNGSYGLTTLRDHHVEIDHSRITFEFKGKSGIKHRISYKDKRIANIVARCQDLPGQILFQYLVENGDVRPIGSSDVNQFLKDATQCNFTAKDFRTWFGSVLAASTLKNFDVPTSTTRAKKNVRRAIEQVSEQLRNTVAVCKKCYVHPAVVEAYMAGELAPEWESKYKSEIKRNMETGLNYDEACFLALLEHHNEAHKRAA